MISLFHTFYLLHVLSLQSFSTSLTKCHESNGKCMKVFLAFATFSPQNSVLATDRQSFARNSACLYRFRAFDPYFGHRQALNRPKLCLSPLFCALSTRFGKRQATLTPKLCLSLPFSCLRPSFRAPTGAESAQTLPVGLDGAGQYGVSPDGAGQYGVGLMEMIHMMSVRG